MPFWGVGWYRKHFEIPAQDEGGKIYLDVDGAMSYANVWLPGPDDISQLSPASGWNDPGGLNYYYNNIPPPGQTFTTSNNLAGYVLNSVSIMLSGNSGSLPANGQPYYLRIYSVSGSAAALYAAYISETDFVLTTGVNDTDWLQWTGFALPLQANAIYAYTFGDDPVSGNGYDSLSNVGGNLYAGGQTVAIPIAGGAIDYGTDNSYDATFDLGLAPSSQSVTLGVQTISGGQLQLQWSNGILLQATNLLGPWVTNVATSPYALTPTAPRMFYRIRVQ